MKTSKNGGYEIGRFCLMVELHQGGSATNWSTPSSLEKKKNSNEYNERQITCI